MKSYRYKNKLHINRNIKKLYFCPPIKRFALIARARMYIMGLGQLKKVWKPLCSKPVFLNDWYSEFHGFGKVAR